MTQRDIDAEVEDVLDAISIWINETFAKIGESPEALRGALVMCDAVVALANAVKDVTPKHIRLETQLVGVLALVAGVSDRVAKVGL